MDLTARHKSDTPQRIRQVALVKAANHKIQINLPVKSALGIVSFWVLLEVYELKVS